MSRAGLVRASRDEFARQFARHSFRIEHELARHELFTMERLLALCARLPTRLVEYNPGDLPATQDPKLTPSNGLSAAETLQRIEQSQSWLVLKYVERDPEYAQLLDRCVDELALCGGLEPKSFFKRAAFIFVSSPHSMTPLHIDPENNFLLQVRGTKCLQVIDRADREVVSEAGLERFAAGGHRNLLVEEALLARAKPYELRPGDGLHVPFTAPHLVRNGPEVSISFSVTFQTAESDREHGARWINHRLRRAGIEPRVPGQSPSLDNLKFGLFRGMRALKRMTKRRE